MELETAGSEGIMHQTDQAEQNLGSRCWWRGGYNEGKARSGEKDKAAVSRATLKIQTTTSSSFSMPENLKCEIRAMVRQ